MNNSPHTEIAVVGSGIVGLAMALAHHNRGRKVTIFDRSARPLGATIRNFGMIWPIGQPKATYSRAMTSRRIWEEMAEKAGFWREAKGSLQLAYAPEELAVLEEFMATAPESGHQVTLMSPKEIADISPSTKQAGLLGGVFSSTEMIVDPRQAAASVATWLMQQGVEIQYQTAVTAAGGGRLVANGKEWRYDQLEICSGSDFETLFPDIFASSGLTRVKLQMMRSKPQPLGWRMGPALCAGLTLTHYASFAHCPSLPALKARIETEMPWMNTWGIHVMMSQNGLGELVIGDSHEYGADHDPFLREEVNQYILEYLDRFVQAPDLHIQERWYGVYAKLPGATEFVSEPEAGIRIVTGLSGAGMTLSFGLAEDLLS
ncbi:MAG: TIGR03364 family FAD-dependent oxidoreductase [Bacteroidia bacterium]|nr:TIGR03364 family FAD-dependent oxidoreductase [Bacteroidia bacterium]